MDNYFNQVDNKEFFAENNINDTIRSQNDIETSNGEVSRVFILRKLSFVGTANQWY
jgi:hypothetical protein